MRPRPSRARASPLELDVLLDAFGQDFARAQAWLEARQLRLVASQAALLPELGLELVPLQLHRIAELDVEFECSVARVRVGRSWRLGLRLDRRRRAPQHRVGVALRAGQGDERPSAELRIDGALVRRVWLPTEAASLGELAEVESSDRRTRRAPTLVLVARRDAARVAAILDHPSPSSRRPRVRARRPRPLDPH